MEVCGVTLALMKFDTRLPDGWQEAATRAKAHWPDVERAFDRHRAHVADDRTAAGQDG